MKTAKEKLVDLAKEIIKDPNVLDNFLEAADIFRLKNVSTGLYFELFHEFGHIAHAIEKGATPIYIKVEKHLFDFTEGDMKYSVTKGSSSNSLMYFEGTGLSEKWIHAVRGGLEFTSKAMGIKTLSIRSKVFNHCNNLDAKVKGENSDTHLLTWLETEEYARSFNTEARQFSTQYLEYGSL